MRAFTRWLNAGLIAFLILGFLPALPYLAPTAEAAPPPDRPLVISEFRLRGPNGANDEFIEITNVSNGVHTVSSTSGAGYGIAASDGIVRAMIPNGTFIPPGGHYLIVNSVGYSLASYWAGNGTTATGDATYTTNIPDNAGIALFSTNVAAYLSTATRIDAAGSTSEANSLYKEGSGYPALTPFSIDYSFQRNECGNTASSMSQSAQFGPCAAPGILQDTNNNALDFVFVDTNGTSAGAGQRLGAPGPQNLSAPLNGCTTGASGLTIAPLDPSAGLFAAPNLVRDYTSDPANNSTFGTLDIRRRVMNNTGAPLTRLRFRVTDIATFPASSGIADLRPRTSTAIVATTSGGTVTVQGTTLEQPASQPNGGGFNSSLGVGAITLATPIPAGGTIDVRFLFGIQQSGDFKLSLQAETLPSYACAETRLVGQTEGTRAFKLVATNGTPQSALFGTAFAAPIRVAVTGDNNSPRPNATVLFTVLGGGAGGTFAGGSTTATVVTDANGGAIAPTFTANGAAGTYNIVARVLNSGGANDVANATATFTLTNTATPQATPSPTASPAASPSASPSTNPEPSASPSASPSPVASPSSSPSPSPVPSTAPGGSAPAFVDVPAGYWAHDQIIAFAQRGITTGCDTDAQGNRYYCPERGVTRAEMAVFLTRSLGQDKATQPTTPTFADVPTDHWAYGQIETFVRLGITTGCGQDAQGRRIFCPERGVTRAEMAAFLTRAQGQAPLAAATATFADVPAGYWAFGQIERFVALGVTSGCGTDDSGSRVYCPERGVTRAEMAVFIIRAYP